MKRKIAGLFALLLTVATAVTGCSGRITLDGTAEAASVNGVSIPLSEVNFYLRYQQAQMQSMYGAYFGEDFMSQDLMGTGTPYGETIRDTVVDTLEEYYIVEANAEDLGVSLSEEEKAAASEAAQAFLAANDSETLEAMTADEAAVTHVLELAALQSKVYQTLAQTIDTNVPDEDVAQKRISYVRNDITGTTDGDGNTTELSAAELAEKEITMNEILNEAKESGDLSAAAEAHDLTATTVTYGQDNNSSLNEDLKAAADELGEGEFSDVVKTDSAYYVVYMESLFDEEATETERQNVLADREQEAYDNWLNPLREAAEITVNDEVLNTIPLEKIFNMKQEETNTEESTDTTDTDTTNTDTTNTETTDTDTTDEETADDAASTDAAEEKEAE